MKTPRTVVALALLACLTIPVRADAAPTVPPTPPVRTPTATASSRPMPPDMQAEFDRTKAEMEATTVTPEMRDAATFPVDPALATLPVDPKSATIPMETKSTDEQGTMTMSLATDILFDFGSADLTPGAAAKIPEILKGIPSGIQVAVNGYTDSIGTEADNLVLSQKRAQAVADVITQSRPDLILTVTGLGEANPVAPNTNPDGTDDPLGRAQNRRVELVYKS